MEEKNELTRGFELANWNYGISWAVLAASRHKKTLDFLIFKTNQYH